MAPSITSPDERRFLELVRTNRANRELLARLPSLRLPDCHLVAGCLFQTVWNCLAGKRPNEDIDDYDVFYFDPSDLSWDREDEAVRRVHAEFADLGVEVQLRNQARVHLWYAQKFGVECAPLRSTRDGIDHFLNQSSCFGVRCDADAGRVYAPFGFDDLYSMIVRPNRRRELPEVYRMKARRWAGAWPGLRVIDWPEPSERSSPASRIERLIRSDATRDRASNGSTTPRTSSPRRRRSAARSPRPWLEHDVLEWPRRARRTACRVSQ